MTPEEMKTSAIKLYGNKYWAKRLAADIGRDYTSVYRWATNRSVRGVPRFVSTFLEVKLRERKLNAIVKKLSKP